MFSHYISQIVIFHFIPLLLFTLIVFYTYFIVFRRFFKTIVYVKSPQVIGVVVRFAVTLSSKLYYSGWLHLWYILLLCTITHLVMIACMRYVLLYVTNQHCLFCGNCPCIWVESSISIWSHGFDVKIRTLHIIAILNNDE